MVLLRLAEMFILLVLIWFVIKMVLSIIKDIKTEEKKK